MDSTRRKLAAVLAGGVLLASVAYGIGTQTGGGRASAVGSPDSSSPSQGCRDHHGHLGLSALAKGLGVDEGKLTAALREIRGEMKPPHREFAADLAQALGLDVDDVKAALKKLRVRHGGEHASRRNAFAKALAEKLEIPVEKVLKALPRRGAHGAHRRGGPGGGPPPHAFDGPGFGPGGPDGPPHGPGGPGGPPPGPGGPDGPDF